MSARYSTSPALGLNIGNSRARRVLHRLLCLLVAFALCRLCQRGYPVVAALLLPVAGLCCWRLARQPLAGTSLHWQRGAWTLEDGTAVLPVTLLPASTFLPWIVYLAWAEIPGGRRASAWVFPDSLPAEQLRSLRVRIVLEC